jgi:hypothetical protein
MSSQSLNAAQQCFKLSVTFMLALLKVSAKIYFAASAESSWLSPSRVAFSRAIRALRRKFNGRDVHDSSSSRETTCILRKRQKEESAPALSISLSQAANREMHLAASTALKLCTRPTICLSAAIMASALSQMGHLLPPTSSP